MLRRRGPCPTAPPARAAARSGSPIRSVDFAAMLVGVDARALTARRGVARYTRRMVEALAALDGVGVRALVPGRHEVEAVAGVQLRRTRAPSRLGPLARGGGRGPRRGRRV